MYTVKGVNGQVSFDGKAITITREGLTGRILQKRGTKVIPLSKIGAVQWQPPSFVRGMGVWSVSVMGEVQSSVSRRDAKDVLSDENSVAVRWRKDAGWVELTEAVNAALVNA